MATATREMTLPSELDRKLNDVRRRQLALQCAAGAIRALGGFLAAMLLAMAVDWLFVLFEPGVRTALTIGALSAGGVLLLLWVIRPLLRARAISDVALDVDDAVPALEERWSTVAELSTSRDRSDYRGADAMIRQVTREAAALDHLVVPERVAETSVIKAPLFIVGAVCAVLLLAILFDAGRTWVLLKRFWSPQAPISFTQIKSDLGDTTIARGDGVLIGAELVSGEQQNATMFIRRDDGAIEQLAMIPVDTAKAAFSYEFESVENSFDYRIRSGDGQTPWHKVTVVERPQLAGFTFRITPPEYSKQEPVQETSLPARIRALQGSRLEIVLQPAGPIQKAELKSGELLFALSSADGKAYRFEKSLTDDFSFSPLLTGDGNLTNLDAPTTRIDVYSDKAPSVKIVTPEDDVAVRPDETIPITFKAEDDLGIARAELVIYDGVGDQKVERKVVEIPIPEPGSAKLEGSIPLDLKEFDLENGAEISYVVRVFDTKESGSTSNADDTPPSSDTELAQAMQPVDRAQEAASGALSQTGEDFESPENPASSPEGSQQRPTGEQMAANDPRNTSEQSTKAQQGGDPQASAAQPQNGEKPDGAEGGEQPTPKEGETPPPTATDPQDQEPADGDPSKGTPPVGKNNQAAPPGSPPAGNNVSPSTGADNEKPADPQDPEAKDEAPNEGTPEEGSPKEESPENPNRVRVSEDQEKEKPPASGEPGKNSAGEPQPAGDAKPQDPQDPEASDTNPPDGTPADPNATPPSDEEMRNAQASSSSSSPQPQMPPNAEEQEASQGEMTGAPKPPDDMIRRGLDVGQSSSSSAMRLRIDEWAGSFEGQAREKLQLQINPYLEELKDVLTQAEADVKPLVELLEGQNPWGDEHSQGSKRADQQLARGEELIARLQKVSAGTPYAFIGLQLVDIGKLHVAPARDNLHAADTKADAEKLSDLGSAHNHVQRALELLDALTKQYETVTRNEKLAEEMQQIEKMHQIFLEDAFQLLGSQKPTLNPMSRKMAELEYSEEYLKKLRELLEKRRDIQAELAKALAEDPRLLRRFMAQAQLDATSLRDQLTLLTERQKELHADVQTWKLDEAGELAPQTAALAMRQKRQAVEISEAASNLFDNFTTWTPLGVDPNSPELKKFGEGASAVAQRGREFVAASQGEDPAATINAARKLYDELNTFEASLPEMAAGEDRALAVNAANRMIETRDLIAATSGWIRKQEYIDEGDPHLAIDVEQYTLAADTGRLALKMETLEQETAAMTGEISEKVRDFSITLNDDLIPEVMDAALPLEEKQPETAAARQAACVEMFVRAEAELDEIMKLMIDFLDAQPIEPPSLADLPDAPTLEQLLAMLEEEARAAEALGIPARPTNLQMQGDWLRPSQGGGGGGMNGAAMAALQSQLSRQRARNVRENMERRVREMTALPEVKDDDRRGIAPELLDWNKLGSKLEDSIRQGRDTVPPKQYRRAIEKYFETIADGLPSSDAGEAMPQEDSR